MGGVERFGLTDVYFFVAFEYRIWSSAGRLCVIAEVEVCAEILDRRIEVSVETVAISSVSPLFAAYELATATVPSCTCFKF